MRFYCKVCERTFTKFVLFEGHFDFSDKCREKHNCFIQCYVCSQGFNSSAALKYHLQHHTIRRFKNSPKKSQTTRTPTELIPKITLKKQWNFKIIPPTQIEEQEPENTQVECKICGKEFRSIFYLKQHLVMHQKKRMIISHQPTKNVKGKAKHIVSAPTTNVHHGKSTSNAQHKEIPSESIVQLPLKRFQCSICKIRLRYGGERLARHMKLHTEGQFKCEICNIKFSKIALSWHRKHFHGKIGQFRCKTCGDSFTSRKCLSCHDGAIHKRGQVKCKICSIRFTPITLIRHQRQKHMGAKKFIAQAMLIKDFEQKELVTKIAYGNLCCMICKAHIQRSAVARHMDNHKHGKFKCEPCNIRFSSLSYAWHRKRFHTEPVNDSTHKCRIREVTVLSDHSLKRHLKMHETGQSASDPTHKCHICEVTVLTYKSLKRHLEMHETGQSKCELCNIRFTRKSLLKHQRNIHPDVAMLEINQPCEICKLRCYTMAALDAHADMHRNGKFQCDTHRIKFTYKALQAHNRLFHSKSDLSGTCPICKVKIVKASHLQQHMDVHTKGTEKCEICNIRFTKYTLIRHQKLVHPNRYTVVPQMRKKLIHKQKMERQRLQRLTHAMQFQCKLCKLLCGDAKKLENHMTAHTAGDVECRICKVPFTKNALLYHEKRFHSEVVSKNLILKALQRHMSDELNNLSESESKEIPNILEEQYKQLVADSKYQCVICKNRFSDCKKLGEYKCDICSIWFTKASLESHQRKFHVELYEERILNGIKLTKEHYEDGKGNEFAETKIVSPQFECDVCKIKCHGYSNLADHKKVHINGDVECTECNIRFTVASLRYHQKRFHPEMEIPIVEHNCTVCKLKFSDLPRLEVHMRVHTEGDVECDECNIPFTKASLLYHMRRFHPRKHSNGLVEKALERNVPSSTTAAGGSTNSHQPNGGEYQCRVCNIECASRKNFDHHMMVHVNGDVKCHICDIWFTKTSLGYHYKRFHSEVNVTVAESHDQQYQCDVCQLMTHSEFRLKEHMKVHRGSIRCHICNVKFTKFSLIYHYKRCHPNVPQEERILKSIENCASRKSLHSCNKCGISFTRICYLKLHLKAHRNAVEPVEIPFVFSPLPPLPSWTTDPAPDSNDSSTGQSDLRSSTDRPIHLTNQSDDLAAKQRTRSYECHVCKEMFTIASRLQDHLSQHVINEPPIDPFNVYLSDWNPNETRELILNQPLVMVENLDLKSLAAVHRTEPNVGIDLPNFASAVAEPEMIGSQSEIGIQNTTSSVVMVASDSKFIDDDIVEILSDSDEDCVTIRQQLNNSANWRVVKEEFDLTDNRTTDEAMYISSDDDDEGDITDSYYCYHCDVRFKTLSEFGEHGKHCLTKEEPSS